jgi:hypothetical protein
MSGSSTRDWLLDKLMKLRQAMTELKIDYERRLAQSEESRAAAVRNAQSAHERFMEAHARMQQMAPEKQFKIMYRGASGDRYPLSILAVNSCNALTTITVERSVE